MRARVPTSASVEYRRDLARTIARNNTCRHGLQDDRKVPVMQRRLVCWFVLEGVAPILYKQVVEPLRTPAPLQRDDAGNVVAILLDREGGAFRETVEGAPLLGGSVRRLATHAVEVVKS